MISEWSRTISNQICENQNEKEIIQYGLNQFFWILLNFFVNCNIRCFVARILF